MTVYLWEAATWSGVSGSLGEAQRRATAHVEGGGQGRIEAALLAMGAPGLTFCYQRTGRSWTARRHPDGTVSWGG
ncbi:MAG: hypothetical protein ACRDN0_14005 [Trebonia sp.]